MTTNNLTTNSTFNNKVSTIDNPKFYSYGANSPLNNRISSLLSSNLRSRTVRTAPTDIIQNQKDLVPSLALTNIQYKVEKAESIYSRLSNKKINLARLVVKTRNSSPLSKLGLKTKVENKKTVVTLNTKSNPKPNLYNLQTALSLAKGIIVSSTISSFLPYGGREKTQPNFRRPNKQKSTVLALRLKKLAESNSNTKSNDFIKILSLSLTKGAYLYSLTSKINKAIKNSTSINLIKPALSNPKPLSKAARVRTASGQAGFSLTIRTAGGGAGRMDGLSPQVVGTLTSKSNPNIKKFSTLSSNSKDASSLVTVTDQAFLSSVSCLRRGRSGEEEKKKKNGGTKSKPNFRRPNKQKSVVSLGLLAKSNSNSKSKNQKGTISLAFSSNKKKGIQKTNLFESYSSVKQTRLTHLSLLPVRTEGSVGPVGTVGPVRTGGPVGPVGSTCGGTVRSGTVGTKKELLTSLGRPRVRNYIKNLSKFDPVLAKSQQLVYNFVPNKNKPIQLNSFLVSSFFYLKSVISKPIYEITPNDITINLFYYHSLKYKGLFRSPNEIYFKDKGKKKRTPLTKEMIFLKPFKVPFYTSSPLLLRRLETTAPANANTAAVRSVDVRMAGTVGPKDGESFYFDSISKYLSKNIFFYNKYLPASSSITSLLSSVSNLSVGWSRTYGGVGCLGPSVSVGRSGEATNADGTLVNNKTGWRNEEKDIKSGKTIQFDLTGLKKPTLESQISAVTIGLITNSTIRNKKRRFRQVAEILFRSTKLSNSKSIKQNLTKTNNSYYKFSVLSGINIKKGGRLKTEKIIPKKTSISIQKGKLNRGITSLVTTNRFTSKSKKGAFSITVTMGHKFF